MSSSPFSLIAGISGSDSILMQYSQGTNYNSTPMQTVQDFLSSEMRLKDSSGAPIPTNNRLRKQGLVRVSTFQLSLIELLTISNKKVSKGN